jgi:RNA polymerase sigma-70 factor (ECF subfamily)
VTTLSSAPRVSASVTPDADSALAEEAILVRAAAAGDARAFEQLVQAHSRRVYGFLLQLTRNSHDADDLTQQTFLKAYRHLDSFDCARPMINWLLTIARRTALNHFRDTRRWEPASEDIASSAPSPVHLLEQAERTENLWARARRLLSAREFEVMWLRFGEEMSTEETARITGLTRIHVKVIVHRARQRLGKGDSVA